MSRKYRHWTASDVLAELRTLVRLAPGYVRDHHPGLYGAANRHFGSWKAAVAATGRDYDSAITRKAHGYWNTERVLATIQSLTKKHSSDVRKNEVSLYSAAIRIFGSWGDAVNASGGDYERVKREHGLERRRQKKL